MIRFILIAAVFLFNDGDAEIIDEYLYVVSIHELNRINGPLDRAKHQGAGVILNKDYVLTGATAVENTILWLLKVQYKFSKIEKGIIIEVEKIILHPDFKHNIMGFNDIALLKINYSGERELKSISLPNQSTSLKIGDVITAFSFASRNDEGVENNHPLKISSLKVVSCQEYVPETYFCAKNTTGEKILLYDRGAPVIHNTEVVGLFLQNYTKLITEVPVIGKFTNIIGYLPFINKYVKN